MSKFDMQMVKIKDVFAKFKKVLERTFHSELQESVQQQKGETAGDLRLFECKFPTDPTKISTLMPQLL